MSRTPLFRFLARSLQLAHHSLHAGTDPSEVLERANALRETRTAERAAAAHERRALALTRREFVGAGVALGAIVGLEGCLPGGRTDTAPRGRADRPVVIVGAGIAGLTAAYRLRQAGVPVRLYEAQNRVGGRIYTLRDYFADGQVVELGGELIDTGHRRIQSLAAELGIALDDLATDDPTLEHERWFFGRQPRRQTEVIAAFRPIAAMIDRDLATLTGDDVTHRDPNDGEALDRTSLAEWLDRNGVSGWIRTLLDVGYTTEYGLEPGRQSSLNLLTMISSSPTSFEIFGDSDERFHVTGGNDRIVTTLGARVDDAIETGHVLEAVRLESAASYRCSFRRGATTVDVVTDQLLLAIPFTLLRTVRLDLPLPAEKRRAIDELGYGTNAKLMVGFSERVWRTRHQCNGSSLTDLPYQLTWETSRLQPGASGVLTNFTGGDHGVRIGAGSAGEQAALLVRDLERVFPGVSAARAGMREVRFHWPSHEWTRGSYASYLTGQWTGMRGVEQETVGNVFFAGEHCSLEAQGFMEGGCETGEVAATGILAARGVRSSSGTRRPEPRRLLDVA